MNSGLKRSIQWPIPSEKLQLQACTLHAGESCALLVQKVLAYFNQDTQENTKLLGLFLRIILVEMDHSFIFLSFVQFLSADVVEITIDMSSVFKVW
jgi:hypothetical protein